MPAEQCRQFDVRHVQFDYAKERWINGTFFLPVFASQYVLLTPVDLLTQSVPWINRPDLFDRFGGMLRAISDTRLRGNVNTFLRQKLAPPPNHPKDIEYRPRKKDVRSAYASALELYPDLANWYIATKETSGAEATKQSMKRVSRAAEIYRERVLNFVSSTLKPSGFFQIDVEDKTQLLSVFAASLEHNGRVLFLSENGLVDELSTDDVRLICALAWRADGNGDRQLPEYRFVSDSKSASLFESGSGSAKKPAGMLVVATDRAKKS